MNFSAGVHKTLLADFNTTLSAWFEAELCTNIEFLAGMTVRCSDCETCRHDGVPEKNENIKV